MAGAVAVSSAQCRAAACTAGGCVSFRFALPRCCLTVWTVAHRRGDNGRRARTAERFAAGRFDLNCRVGGSARGKEGPSSRHCAECFVYRALSSGQKGPVIASSCINIYRTPLRARPRHRVIVRAQNTCKPGRGRYRGAGRGNSKNCKQGTRSGQIGARHCVIVHSAKAGPWSVARAAVQSTPCPPWRVAVHRAAAGLPDRKMWWSRVDGDEPAMQTVMPSPVRAPLRASLRARNDDRVGAAPGRCLYTLHDRAAAPTAVGARREAQTVTRAVARSP